MGTKLDPGRFDCYAAAAPEEPYFMLLARDRDAAALVNLWTCMRRLRQDPKDAEKIAEAEQCANDMVAWLIEHKGQDPNGVKTLAQALALLAEMVGAVWATTATRSR